MTKKLTAAMAILGCLAIACLYSEKKSAQMARPPLGATNLPAFLEARPDWNQIRGFVHQGKPHLQVVGNPILLPLSPPSGPPAYIFDETGALVDWCRDLGDNPSFARRWSNFSNAVPVSAEEAKKLLKRGE